MKKILCLLCLIFTCLFLSSCEKKPNMDELLSYQENAFQMKLHITDGEVFTVALQNENDNLLLYFEEEPLAKIGYLLDTEGNLSLTLENLSVPIESEWIQCKAWLSLFRIHAGDGIWKIKKENLGGISVFVCKNEEITLYFDAATRQPLKLVSGDIEIDVISFENGSS